MNRKLGLVGLLMILMIVVGTTLSTSRVTGQVDRSVPGGRVSVLDFGAVGDGKTDDRKAIQAAIDAGDEIHFPEVRAFYRVLGSLQIGGSQQIGGKRLIGHRPCRGGGAFQGKPSLIHGDGTETLFVANGTTHQNRAIELQGISATNTGKPVLDLMSGVDAMVDNCSLKTFKNEDATIRIRESYNVSLRESSLFCSGGGFAVTAYQQCNVLRVQNCRLGGGDLGGAVHVEQSANVLFESNIVELGVYGLVVASGIRLDHPNAGVVDGAGACHALRVVGNYFENVQHPMVFGSALHIEKNLGQAVFGAVIESNYVGTYGFDFPLVTIGRVEAASIRGNSFWRKSGGNSAAIYATFARGANPSHPTKCIVDANHLSNGSGPFFGADEEKVGDVPYLELLNSENKIISTAP